MVDWTEVTTIGKKWSGLAAAPNFGLLSAT